MNTHRIHTKFVGDVRMSDQVLSIFKECGAIQEGHFILSSGLHSNLYLQKMAVFSSPSHTETLCKLFAQRIKEAFGTIDVVLSLALGGIIPGYETARHLNAKAMFLERSPEGCFVLKRGFRLEPKDRVIIIEDILTTGSSILEGLECLKHITYTLKGIAAIIDRTNDISKPFDHPYLALCKLDIPLYTSDNLPTELKKMPAVKPGTKINLHTTS